MVAEQGEEKAQDEFGEAPDGGLQAWLVATGASLAIFSALGYANSFGVFQEYYMTHQLREESVDRISWIGSTSAFLQLASCVIGGPFFVRFGALVCPPPPPSTSGLVC